MVIVPTLYYVRFAGPPGGFGPSSTEPAPLGTTRSLEPHLNPRAKPASSWASEWLSIVIPVLLAGVAIGAVGAWVLTVRARRREEPLQIVTVTQNPSDAGLQVFVSYSHLDAKTVDGLVHQIEGMGYAVWIDRDTSGTHRYAEAIVHAIRTSKLVALMCSRNAFASDQVIREIYVAGDFKKPFIAFQLDLADFPDEVLYFISGFPRIPIASVDAQQLRTELDRLIAT